MSTVKTKINAQVVTDFLKQQYNVADVTLETIADGEMSQAYFFAVHGQQKVLRINATTDEGFRKDMYAKEHFASKQLLIPAIEDVGQLDNGMYFAISERSVGKTLYAFTTGELIRLLPEIIATAEAIHAIEPPGTARSLR
jgi:hygromycin-B 4-O-kinase